MGKEAAILSRADHALRMQDVVQVQRDEPCVILTTSGMEKVTEELQRQDAEIPRHVTDGQPQEDVRHEAARQQRPSEDFSMMGAALKVT